MIGHLVNIMDQYYPSYKAFYYPPLDRRITGNKFTEAVKLVREAGLTYPDRQRDRAIAYHLRKPFERTVRFMMAVITSITAPSNLFYFLKCSHCSR